VSGMPDIVEVQAFTGCTKRIAMKLDRSGKPTGQSRTYEIVESAD
jgi:hypothetical protein